MFYFANHIFGVDFLFQQVDKRNSIVDRKLSFFWFTSLFSIILQKFIWYFDIRA